jgi:hypothetical protein
MHIACFTPLPPVRTTAAVDVRSLLPRLTPPHLVDVFVEDRVWSAGRTAAPSGSWRALEWKGDDTPPPEPGALRVFRAWDFAYAQAGAPYDLVIYFLGHTAPFDYIWPYLVRLPGLVVLHDRTLHAARLRRLLYLARQDDYREEFAFCHPGIALDATDDLIEGVRGAAMATWPMLRLVMETARGVAVASSQLATELSDAYPSTPIAVISPNPPSAPGTLDALTEMHALPAKAPGFTFALVGTTTAATRRHVQRAFSHVRARQPDARLLMIDERNPDEPAENGEWFHAVPEGVELVMAESDEAVEKAIAAADACLWLEWPVTRAFSRRWLQGLAMGKPTVMFDSVALVDMPLTEPMYWTLRHADTDARALRPRDWRDAAAVSIDATMEPAQLSMAMTRLAEDDALRDAIGANGRSYCEAHFTLDGSVRDALAAITWCHGLPDPAPSRDLPPHVRADGTRTARDVLAEFGVRTDLFR